MRYNKIPKEAKGYIRAVVLIIYIATIIVVYMIHILVNEVINIHKYIPFKIDIFLTYKIILSIVTIISVILFVVLPKIISNNNGYYIDNYFFKIKSGIIFKTISIVLAKDVYKISVGKKILGRIFKISSITIYTSAGSIKINYLDDKKREALFNNIAYAMKKYGEENV